MVAGGEDDKGQTVWRTGIGLRDHKVPRPSSNSARDLLILQSFT